MYFLLLHYTVERRYSLQRYYSLQMGVAQEWTNTLNDGKVKCNRHYRSEVLLWEIK